LIPLDLLLHPRYDDNDFRLNADELLSGHNIGLFFLPPKSQLPAEPPYPPEPLSPPSRRHHFESNQDVNPTAKRKQGSDTILGELCVLIDTDKNQGTEISQGVYRTHDPRTWKLFQCFDEDFTPKPEASEPQPSTVTSRQPRRHISEEVVAGENGRRPKTGSSSLEESGEYVTNPEPDSRMLNSACSLTSAGLSCKEALTAVQLLSLSLLQALVRRAISRSPSVRGMVVYRPGLPYGQVYKRTSSSSALIP
jgi:hypothetical protein